MNQSRMGNAGMAVMAAVLMAACPGVFAQPLEVGDVETTRAAVETQVERLVTELVARDPELAQEIERQSEACLRDMSDGQLEAPEFTKEIETYRDVQRDLAERAGMKEMFEAAERGEMARPTPEMMERMREEMGEYLKENPQMREYAAVEWDRMMEHGPDQGGFGPMDRDMAGGPENWRDFGPGHDMPDGMMPHDMDMPEGMSPRDRFDAWAEGRDPSEIERAKGEFERYFEAPEREREYGTILDNRSEFSSAPPPPESGGTPPPEDKPHTLVQDNPPGMHDGWDGGDPDSLPDHPHPDGTAPHTGI